MRECPSGNGCCTAAVHCFLLGARHGDGLRQYDLHRDMRTHGQNEQLLTESRERRSVYLKFADELIQALKLPVGRDGFCGEIHPKLRPVGTAVEGVTIAGACQGPKTAESAASGLAATAGDVGLVPVPACHGSPPPARRRLCARGREPACAHRAVPAGMTVSCPAGRNRRSRRLLVTTNTELNAIAAAAISGLRNPRAASGMAAVLL